MIWELTLGVNMFNLRFRTNQHGFTLTEILVVLTIIGILSSLAVPSYMTYKYQTKRTEAMIVFTHVIKTSKVFWSQKGSFPGISIVKNGLPRASFSRNDKYIGSTQIFKACPVNEDCQLYNYDYHVGGRYYRMDQRNNIHPLLVQQTPITIDYSRFQFYAAGVLTGDTNRTGYADLIYYDSATNKVLQLCDSLEQIGPNCNPTQQINL